MDYPDPAADVIAPPISANAPRPILPIHGAAPPAPLHQPSRVAARRSRPARGVRRSASLALDVQGESRNALGPRLTVHQCAMMVLFQNKIIYMPGKRPAAATSARPSDAHRRATRRQTRDRRGLPRPLRPDLLARAPPRTTHVGREAALDRQCIHARQQQRQQQRPHPGGLLPRVRTVPSRPVPRSTQHSQHSHTATPPPRRRACRTSPPFSQP